MTSTIVIAAGGTGGHIFPAQSVAEALRAKGYQVLFVTDRRYFRYHPGASEDPWRVVLPAVPFSKKPLALLRSLWLNLLSVYQSICLLLRYRAIAVVGFGGYPALPVLIAASLCCTPIFLHEQNAVLGKTNRLFAKQAKLLMTGLPDCTHVPKGVRTLHTGNPVRAPFLEARTHPYQASEDKIRILVVGGSQGAAIFDQTIPEALSLLPAALQQRLDVTEQCAEKNLSAIASTYDQCGITHRLAPFFTDIPALLAASHLVIARAGASSIAEITVVGRPSILIPYPFAIFDHQRLNAASLVQAGAAECIVQQELDAEKLAALLRRLLEDTEILKTMASAAHSLGNPDAVEIVCQCVLAR